MQIGGDTRIGQHLRQCAPREADSENRVVGEKVNAGSPSNDPGHGAAVTETLLPRHVCRTDGHDDDDHYGQHDDQLHRPQQSGFAGYVQPGAVAGQMRAPGPLRQSNPPTATRRARAPRVRSRRPGPTAALAPCHRARSRSGSLPKGLRCQARFHPGSPVVRR